MKIHELQEARGALGRNTHSILMRNREKRATEKHAAKLVRLKKDGAESGMHDATSTYPTEADARAKHTHWVKLNPGRDIRHNLYVDGKLVQVLDPTTLTEVRHQVGADAEKALNKTGVKLDQDQAMHKWQQLDRKEQEIMSRPDVHTGKYAKELMNISRQKIKMSKAGGLNASGKPLTETASGGGTSSGSVASLPMHQGKVIHQPNLFGYVPVSRKTRTKSVKK